MHKTFYLTKLTVFEDCRNKHFNHFLLYLKKKAYIEYRIKTTFAHALYMQMCHAYTLHYTTLHTHNTHKVYTCAHIHTYIHTHTHMSEHATMHTSAINKQTSKCCWHNEWAAVFGSLMYFEDSRTHNWAVNSFYMIIQAFYYSSFYYSYCILLVLQS